MNWSGINSIADIFNGESWSRTSLLILIICITLILVAIVFGPQISIQLNNVEGFEDDIEVEIPPGTDEREAGLFAELNEISAQVESDSKLEKNAIKETEDVNNNTSILKKPNKDKKEGFQTKRVHWAKRY